MCKTGQSNTGQRDVAAAALNQVVKLGLAEKVTLEQRFEGFGGTGSEPQ